MKTQKRLGIIGGFWHWFTHIFIGRPWWVKIISAVCTLVVCFMLFVLAVATNFLWLFGKSPSIDDIMHPKTPEASIVYSADGEVIGKYYNENRTPVSYDDVNPVFFKALIDTEDERFYEHHGIDFKGVLAAGKDYVLHGRARGASTITQQLVKNMFKVRTQYSTGLLGKIPGLGILIMKTKEWILASEIEFFYDKREILEMYANTVDFGCNSFGVNTAARTYFGVEPKDLTVEQSAVLVGLLKATTSYNPRYNPKDSEKRRNVVLDNMRQHGHLTAAEYDSISKIPIDMSRFNMEVPTDGSCQYFRQAVLDHMEQWCQANGVDLFTDGLKIYTTIDTRMQRYAEQAVAQQMKQVQQNFNANWNGKDCWVDEKGRPIEGFVEDVARRSEVYRQLMAAHNNQEDTVLKIMRTRKHRIKVFDYSKQGYKILENSTSMDSIRYMLRFMHAGFVALEPETGFVKAWVGDIDYNSWKYDKVTSLRQPGSTFKLFVYAAAMDYNPKLSPCSTEIDNYEPIDVYDRKRGQYNSWQPRNSSGKYSNEMMTYRQAFAQSVNTVAVKVGMRAGLPRVAQTARDMGITSGNLQETPALSLGASDVSLLELVNGYATAANKGSMHPPVLVTRIVNREGVEIYNYRTQGRPGREAIGERTAFYLQQMLIAGRTDPGGTSQRLNTYIGDALVDTDFGGKTGTTNNHSDAWFIGVSPRLVCGAWVGGEYRSIHFSTAAGQGSRTALPICGLFFQKLMTDKQFKNYHARFTRPNCYIDVANWDCATFNRDSTDLYADPLLTDTIDLDRPYDLDPPSEDFNNAHIEL